ncbi:TRAP transporter small permease subunit [Yoonia vestfoldensis]|uniref:C4-dicarboxylate ABC transporter permease n=1 Tax=Yoonia vestfoldensis TaxID=245188 RepID=A0A1Y0EC63_9RHOB|nr:C4-dicarboxylate ABC transporter permease [Yoonia vestfoldensis]ARU00990.1 C4-dicarboxylate ABC transporter permease [Yoonia vestfoldensis]
MELVDAWGGNAFGWLAAQLIAAVYHIGFALLNPGLWLAWVPQINGPMDPAAKEALARFIYYGASVELFFAVLVIFAAVTAAGMLFNAFMWRCVRALEGFANGVGRVAAWAGLVMVLQQIMIIFLQGIFAVSDISIGFGVTFERPVSWWSDELKLYNAIVITMCATYTFVQGGHVRVDLFYAPMRFRAKRCVDMFGALVFMLPASIVIWIYGWFFMWRHLVLPNASASDSLDRLMTRSQAFQWNIETISTSANGFDAYFLFKILLLIFTFMVMLQAVAVFYRAFLEWKEGPASEGRYLDKDKPGDQTAELVAKIH